MDYISVYNARDQFEASRIIDLLKENSIESYSREAGGGEYLKVTGNVNPFGTEIIVDSADSDRARKLIRNMLDHEKNRSEDELTAETPDEEAEIIKALYRRNLAVRIVVAIVLVGGLLGLVLGMIV